MTYTDPTGYNFIDNFLDWLNGSDPDGDGVYTGGINDSFSEWCDENNISVSANFSTNIDMPYGNNDVSTTKYASVSVPDVEVPELKFDNNQIYSYDTNLSLPNISLDASSFGGISSISNNNGSLEMNNYGGGYSVGSGSSLINMGTDGVYSNYIDYPLNTIPSKGQEQRQGFDNLLEGLSKPMTYAGYIGAIGSLAENTLKYSRNVNLLKYSGNVVGYATTIYSGIKFFRKPNWEDGSETVIGGIGIFYWPVGVGYTTGKGVYQLQKYSTDKLIENGYGDNPNLYNTTY